MVTRPLPLSNAIHSFDKSTQTQILTDKHTFVHTGTHTHLQKSNGIGLVLVSDHLNCIWFHICFPILEICASIACLSRMADGTFLFGRLKLELVISTNRMNQKVLTDRLILKIIQMIYDKTWSIWFNVFFCIVFLRIHRIWYEFLFVNLAFHWFQLHFSCFRLKLCLIFRWKCSNTSFANRYSRMSHL